MKQFGLGAVIALAAVVSIAGCGGGGHYILSFAGTLTFKNAPELREAVALVPVEQLLVETDSPFLAPMPNRGSLNTPAQIPNTLRVMADLRGESVDYLAGAISENAERIFGKF